MKNRIGNSGYSLVELIVVISIMAVMVSLTSLGLSVMFSKDAAYAAVRIDDGLTEARTLAMTKDGVFTCIIHADNDPDGDHKGGYVRIDQTITDDLGVSTTNPGKPVRLDKPVTIDSTGVSFDADGNIKVVFDKANGSVKLINGAAPVSGAVYTITTTAAKNTSKKSTVTLVPTTGRHYTEK